MAFFNTSDILKIKEIATKVIEDNDCATKSNARQIADLKIAEKIIVSKTPPINPTIGTIWIDTSKIK